MLMENCQSFHGGLELCLARCLSLSCHVCWRTYASQGMVNCDSEGMDTCVDNYFDKAPL